KVARAVQYAHAQGILHRDLKPGNILLDGRGEPLVSDFGLAKWLDTASDLTRTLTIFGTPGYVAPEQAKGSTQGLRPGTDVYSLGAILFDLLTGRPPFLGDNVLIVIQQAAETPAPKLRSLAPALDRACTVPGGNAVSARATGEPPPRPTVPPRPWNSVHDTPASAHARATSSCTRYRAHAEGKSPASLAESE